MPLYAYDGTQYIYASDAAQGGSYRCIECKAPVKIRRGKNRIAHFYHIQTTPSCRLYSKSKDHLLIQLQLQRLLPKGEGQIEAPLLSVHRIADLLWEKEKIVFEVQCSSLYVKEAENRIIDYRKMGYEIVWLLDDRLFNRRTIRPAEFFLRKYCCYFFRFQRNKDSIFYDQLEITSNNKRVKKSKLLPVNLRKIHWTPSIEWPSFLPIQISLRIPNALRYCKGDLIDRALLSDLSPFIRLYLKNWSRWEKQWATKEKSSNQLTDFLKNKIFYSYISWLEKVLATLE